MTPKAASATPHHVSWRISFAIELAAPTVEAVLEIITSPSPVRARVASTSIAER